MAVPYEDVLNVFHSRFQSTYILNPLLEKQFFLTALSDFELDLYELEYDNVSEQIENDLSRSEINILGRLMYVAYLARERDKILKLNNIVGKDIKLTAMGDSKRTINDAYEKEIKDVQTLIGKLKDFANFD